MTSDSKAIPFFTANRSPSFFWMLGLFYGDGWLTKATADPTIGFCGSIEVMEKLEDLIGGIRRKRKDAYDFELLVINSRQLFNWFMENTDLIGGKKSHTITFPRKLLQDSPENTWHFLRGFFDADGFVSAFNPNLLEKKTKGIPELRVGISTSSDQFISDMKNFFDTQLGFSPPKSSSDKIMNGKTFTCHSLTFKSSKKVRIFLDKLYENKADYFYSRKYLRYVHLRNFQDSLYEAKCKACLANPLWHFRKGLCINCFHMERKKFCICGESVLALGICQSQYHRYKRLKLINLLSEYIPDYQALISEKNFTEIDKSLKHRLTSFYAAKHEGFISFAEYWDNKIVSDIRLETEAARKNTAMIKPASWFKSKDAFKIVSILKERFPEISKCFDPFAGWGTRAAGVLAHDLEYVGVDLNTSLVHELKSFYSEDESALFLEGNSYELDFRNNEEIEGSDFVLTCPPYWRAEDYGYRGYSSRKYSGFIRDLFKLMVNMSLIPGMKVMAICLEDFSFKSKKYKFVRDFEFFLEKHEFNYEKIVYTTKHRSLHNDSIDQNVFIIECDKVLMAQSFEKHTFAKSDLTCSVDGCRNKHEAKGFCKLHYFKDYHLKKMGGVLKRQPIPADASRICKIEGCERDVHAHGVCNSHYYHLKPKAEKKIKEKTSDKKIYPCTHPDCTAQYQHKENLCLVHWKEKNGIAPGKITGRPGKEMVDCKECGKPESATQPSLLCPKCYGRWYRAQNPDKRLKKNQP